jgi:hypothetical protein
MVLFLQAFPGFLTTGLYRIAGTLRLWERPTLFIDTSGEIKEPQIPETFLQFIRSGYAANWRS